MLVAFGTFKMKLRSTHLFLFSLSSTHSLLSLDTKRRRSNSSKVCVVNMSVWSPFDKEQEEEARTRLSIWPLDEYNAKTLNEVHPRDYAQSTEKVHEIYDLIALGAGAGGLVSST